MINQKLITQRLLICYQSFLKAHSTNFIRKAGITGANYPLFIMRESLMLSSLTVGEKQHPKLGGCVRVFFQLFDWNRRLSCKKRIFSHKQLHPERTMRRTFIQHRDGGAETSCINADANQVFLLTNGEEEDNLQIKEVEISWEEEGMEKSEDMIHEPVTSSVFFSGTGSFDESALKVKSPGVIGKLMGLESLPSPTHLPLTHTPLPKRKQKPHATHTPLPASVVIPQHDHTHKVLELAFQHSLPDEELDALLAELNGSMSTILSALPPHIGISSRRRHRSSSSTTPPTHSTTLPNSPAGISSPPRSSPVTFSRTKVSATSMVGISSPSKALLSPRTSRAHVSLTTGVASCQCPVDENSNHLESARSLGGHAMCLRDDVFECEEQIMLCAGAGEGDIVRNIKNAKKMKQKSMTSVGGKRLSEKSVNADIHGVNMELNVQCTPQELQDVERSTCKTARRKKVDGSIIQQRLQREGVGDHQPLEERAGSLKNSPNDQAVPHRKQEGGYVRDLPYDQSRRSLASRKASKINCAHDPSSTDFAINYNVAFFDEYHKSRSKVGPASTCKHSDDNVADRAQKSNLIAEAVAYHDRRRSNAGSNSDAGPKGEASSLIRVLMNRRVAREAAATGAIKAAGILHTASIPVVNMPAVDSNGDDSVQNMISSCKMEQDSDPNHREKLSAGRSEPGDRREKLSAGRSEAGGGDFIQVIYPMKYGTVECCTAAASGGNCECSVQAGVISGRDNQWVVASGLGSAAGLHRGVCMPALPMVCTKESGGVGGRLQREVCGIQAGGGKNTTAAILQDVISALSTPVSASGPCHHHHHHLSEDDAGTPSTNDGHDTESTWSSGGCWAAASQPSPVSVLISPFDDDVSPGEGDTNWIQSEDHYVAVLLDAMSDTGKRNLPPAELFGKLEERVIAAWPDSEVPPTSGYRRLVFDCVREALGQAGALKDGRGNRRWRARVLFEEMCQWRRGAGDIVLDDLVEADLKKPCNRWVGFEVQTREIALLLERTFFDLLVEELVCDLVLF